MVGVVRPPAPCHELRAEAGTLSVQKLWAQSRREPLNDREQLFRLVEPIQLEGDITAPEPWESGFKDTVIAYPGEVTRIKARFDNPGQFVWHCHIVEHEDNEMMRPYRVGPEQPGQPE